MKTLLGKLALVLGLCLSMNAAHSLTLTFIGLNSGTFVRPNEGTPPTTVGTGAVPFDSLTFTVNTSGIYTLLSQTDPTRDNYTFLYANNFDPQNPLLNVVLGNDDYLGIVGISGFTTSLVAGTTYTFVSTVIDSTVPTTFGDWTTTIKGVGTAIPVPEAGSSALMAIGLAAVLLVSQGRRRARSTALHSAA